MGSSASNVAWSLFKAYRDRGHSSRLAVNKKRREDPNVRAIPRDLPGGTWAPAWTAMSNGLLSIESKIPRGVGPLGRIMREIAHPGNMLSRAQGIEEFDYPGSWAVLDLWPDRPDIVQCHTLHGGYFDLRSLPWLSSRVPVVLTPHDAWHLSGHCAHSLSCERWKTGCGNCPDLTLYPSARRDATAYNWQRKREIYRKSRLHVAVPSNWLRRKVEESILMDATVDLRVISNGVDLTVFRPGEKEDARRRLGLPANAKILLFAAMQARTNSYKDYATVRAAGLRVGEYLRNEQILVLTIGENGASERVENVEFRFVPPQHEPSMMVPYYQAADVYVHAAHAETQPLVLMEAMACGRPSVATAVGGIPEVIEDGRTGYLVPYRDAEAMAGRVEELLTDPTKMKRIEENARREAPKFDFNRQVELYLNWFSQLAGRP